MLDPLFIADEFQINIDLTNGSRIGIFNSNLKKFDSVSAAGYGYSEENNNLTQTVIDNFSVWVEWWEIIKTLDEYKESSDIFSNLKSVYKNIIDNSPVLFKENNSEIFNEIDNIISKVKFEQSTINTVNEFSGKYNDLHDNLLTNAELIHVFNYYTAQKSTQIPFYMNHRVVQILNALILEYRPFLLNLYNSFNDNNISILLIDLSEIINQLEKELETYFSRSVYFESIDEQFLIDYENWKNQFMLDFPFFPEEIINIDIFFVLFKSDSIFTLDIDGNQVSFDSVFSNYLIDNISESFTESNNFMKDIFIFYSLLNESITQPVKFDYNYENALVSFVQYKDFIIKSFKQAEKILFYGGQYPLNSFYVYSSQIYQNMQYYLPIFLFNFESMSGASNDTESNVNFEIIEEQVRRNFLFWLSQDETGFNEIYYIVPNSDFMSNFETNIDIITRQISKLKDYNLDKIGYLDPAKVDIRVFDIVFADRAITPVWINQYYKDAMSRVKLLLSPFPLKWQNNFARYDYTNFFDFVSLQKSFSIMSPSGKLSEKESPIIEPEQYINEPGYLNVDYQIQINPVYHSFHNIQKPLKKALFDFEGLISEQNAENLLNDCVKFINTFNFMKKYQTEFKMEYDNIKYELEVEKQRIMTIDIENMLRQEMSNSRQEVAQFQQKIDSKVSLLMTARLLSRN